MRLSPLCGIYAPALLLGTWVQQGEAQGQSSAPVARAAATITAQDVARHIGIIADDSMLGRDTPSRGLDLTARYVADQFRAFGLRPGGDRGSWLQHYTVARRRLDLERSQVIFSAGGRADSAGFTTSARYEGGPIPEKTIRGSVVLVSGQHRLGTSGELNLVGRVVIYVPPWESDPDLVQETLQALYLSGPTALVTLSGASTERFRQAIPSRAPERVVVQGSESGPVVLQVHAAAVGPSLAAAEVDLDRLQRDPDPSVQTLDRLRITVDLRDTVLSSLSAPNTVGILEGSDPTLKNEYLVYSAHMDHIGITPGRPDSINNGADDDASGTAGVIELAQAFSRRGARPLRSLVFLTVSGEEQGLWGSNYFSANPPVPVENIVANINLDMISRNWPDTIVAIGKEHSTLGTTLDRVNSAHPELGITAIDDQWPDERFYYRSDHYNFARRGVPILFFFNGVHEDYHQVTDSPDKVNAEKESRILKLLFYLGQDIANAESRPTWNEESYSEIVEEKSVRGNAKRER
ncbi:MAG TPA: M28 family peptidase [Gemmatimonadales bacterium]|nr:M28 family peptidase [Gemmatimonadales bacterium]